MPRKKLRTADEELIVQLEATMKELIRFRDEVVNPEIELYRTTIRRLLAQLSTERAAGKKGLTLPDLVAAHQKIFEGASSLLPVTSRENLPKGRKVKKAVSSVLPELPQTGKKPREKKVRRSGINMYARKILQLAFGGETVPKTLEEVLLGLFGANWADAKFSIMRKGHKGPFTTTLGEDLAHTDSALRVYLTNAYEVLELYEQGTKADLATIHSEALRLFKAITEKHSIEEVEKTLKQWGVLIETKSD